jgi:hypothetical protein
MRAHIILHIKENLNALWQRFNYVLAIIEKKTCYSIIKTL